MIDLSHCTREKREYKETPFGVGGRGGGAWKDGWLPVLARAVEMYVQFSSRERVQYIVVGLNCCRGPFDHGRLLPSVVPPGGSLVLFRAVVWLFFGSRTFMCFRLFRGG